MKLARAIIIDSVYHRAFEGTAGGDLGTPNLRGEPNEEGPAPFLLEVDERNGTLRALRLSDQESWLFSAGMWHGQPAAEAKKK